MRTLKIFIACATGSALGTFVSLGLNHQWWPLGLVLGFVTGYLSYEYRQVAAAVSTAWRKVSSWQPDKERWKLAAMLVIPVAGCSLTMILGAFGPLYLLYLFEGNMMIIYGLLVFTTFVPIVCGVLIPLLLYYSAIPGEQIVECRKLFLDLNPFRVYLRLVPKYTLRGVIYFIRKVPAIFSLGFSLGWRFLKEFLLIIHSDIRLLCGVDAAIGAAIGYFAGSVMVGLAAGGLFGVLNYEIVSKKLLKIKI